MRGVKAKKLRRFVYGDLSLRAPRQYAVRKTNTATILNHPESPRATYQRRKARYLTLARRQRAS